MFLLPRLLKILSRSSLAEVIAFFAVVCDMPRALLVNKDPSLASIFFKYSAASRVSLYSLSCIGANTLSISAVFTSAIFVILFYK